MIRAAASQPTWEGSLRDLAAIIATLRQARAFGRLTLRNTARLGVAHLYVQRGVLVHAVSTRGDTRSTLEDLRLWAKAMVRFERGVTAGDAGRNSGDYDHVLDEVIAHLQSRGVVDRAREPSVPVSRVIESHLVTAPAANAGQLIAPFEWKLLVEGTRRISLAVAHLVGPGEAMSALRDILDDCIAGFPSLAGLHIVTGGYVQVADGERLDRVPRVELLEGFAALFAICQHFCAPIIGDEDAHRLMLQSLGDLAPHLAGLGIFPITTSALPHSQTSDKPYRG